MKIYLLIPFICRFVRNIWTTLAAKDWLACTRVCTEKTKMFSFKSTRKSFINFSSPWPPKKRKGSQIHSSMTGPIGKWILPVKRLPSLKNSNKLALNNNPNAPFHLLAETRPNHRLLRINLPRGLKGKTSSELWWWPLLKDQPTKLDLKSPLQWEVDSKYHPPPL